MKIQIFENRTEPLNNTGLINNPVKGFSNHTEFVYDRHFRRKAFFRHLANNREFRSAILTGFTIVLTLFTTFVLVLIPLMKNLIY